MHSDVYDRIWVKLSMVIDTVVLYLWSLASWPWPSFKVTLVRETKNCTNYLTKFVINLNWIWFTIETCWCDQLHTHFILSIQYSLSWRGKFSWDAFHVSSALVCQFLSAAQFTETSTTKSVFLWCQSERDVHLVLLSSEWRSDEPNVEKNFLSWLEFSGYQQKWGKGREPFL